VMTSGVALCPMMQLCQDEITEKFGEGFQANYEGS